MGQTSPLELAVNHLNASVGPVLEPAQLSHALRVGSVREMSAPPLAAALVSSLFVELSPSLIMQCAAEAGATLSRVNQLYRETLADALPPVRGWEEAVGHLL